MGKIVILDENTANQIAAGEVIERPASIVKELVENALDAGASAITAEIVSGGKKSIRVTDNGGGMEADDVAMAFERHATSKIRRIDDLNRLATLGFRGEALASIASVAKVEVVTKTEAADTGLKVEIEAGRILSSEPAGAPKGTTLVVRELFYNTPARYKFLKKDATEAGYVSDVLSRIALANPDVSLKLINQGKTVLHTPGNHDLLSVIYSIYGKDIARSVLPVKASNEGVAVSGYIGKPEVSRGNRGYQSVLINGRFVQDRIVTAALEQAYKTKMMQKRFPFAVLKLQLSPQLVDVNVHPAKMEVRFADEKKVFHGVYHAVSEALAEASLIQDIREKKRYRQGFTVGNKIPEQTALQAEPRKKEEIITEPDFSASSIPTVKTQNGSVFPSMPEKRGEKESGINEPMEKKPFVPPQKDETNHETQRIPQDNRAEDNAERKDDTERLLRAKVVGQAFSSFVFLEEGGDLFLIDQHAAHERIRYETLVKQYASHEPASQGLLSPMTITLTELEMERFHTLSEYFKRMGFEAEDFGSRTVIVRAVPYFLDGFLSERDFTDLLEKLYGEAHAVSEMIPEETLYMMACKSAMKANREMSEMEMKGLVKALVNTENPYTCVHGRPVIIRMAKKELEKRFKRIV